MPVDARILLGGRVPDISSTVNNGLMTGRNLRNDIDQAPMRNRMLEQGVEQNEQSLAQGEQAIDQSDRAKQMEFGAMAYEAASILRNIPMHQRAAVGAKIEERMRAAGHTIDDGPDDYSDEALDQAMAATKPFDTMYRGMKGNQQKGASGLVKDDEGNMFHTLNVFDPKTGGSTPQLRPVNPNGPQEPVGSTYPINASGLTMTEDIDMAGQKSENDSQIRIRQGIAKDAFEGIGKATKAIGNIDTAIQAVLDGANTGPIDQWFPSFKTSTIELQNAANRMGLDIISAVTFGALSAGEMKLAMDTAVPMGLEGPALIKYLRNRKAAQHKLRAEMTKAAQHFEGGGSISDYLDSMKIKGDYITRADLPLLAGEGSDAKYDALKIGSYYLEPNEETGEITAYEKTSERPGK